MSIQGALLIGLSDEMIRVSFVGFWKIVTVVEFTDVYYHLSSKSLHLKPIMNCIILNLYIL